MPNIQDIYRCTPNQVKKYVEECIKAQLVPFIQSSPGCGKSAIVKQIAQEYNLELIDLRLSTCDPTDLTGLPHFTKDGKAEFMPFNIFPLENTPLPKGKDGWLLFLDEFNSATKMVQAAAYKLVLDRQVGIHNLHPYCAVVAAGNLATDRAIVNSLSTAMQSRVIHLEMQVNFDQWLQNVALKQNYDKRIIAFLSMYNSKLMDFDPDHQEKTFCCPRTWEFVNRLVKDQPITDECAPLLAGTITSGVAVEFVQFCQVYKNLVTVNQILKDPDNCPIPKETAVKWAVVSSILENVTTANFDKIAKYMERFEDISFKILFYRSLYIRNPEIQNLPAFGKAMASISHRIYG